MKKFAAMLVCLTAMVSSLVSAQEPVQTSIRQSAVFLEQIIGTWATVLPSWNRAPESADWRMARQRCTTPIDSMQPKAIENADPKPPAADMMFGNIVFYRGPQGLQQYSVTDNEIRLFPDLRVGSAKSGSPAYQISGSGGVMVLTVGKIPSDTGPTIVMVRQGGLYMRCVQE